MTSCCLDCLSCFFWCKGWAQPPTTSFDNTPQPPVPDYTQESSWAAFPGNQKNTVATMNAPLKNTNTTSPITPLLSSCTPPATNKPSNNQTSAASVDEDKLTADCFYIHPTGAFGRQWNCAIDDPAASEMVNHFNMMDAAALNHVARIYAPRYRQMAYPIYLMPRQGKEGNEEGKTEQDKAFDLAYTDVERAFLHFIHNENQDRPFFITSHSQGTMHALRLLHSVVDQDSALAQRCVCCYLLGGYTQIPSDIDQHLKHFHPSTSSTDAPGSLVAFSLRSKKLNTEPFTKKMRNGELCLTNGPGRWDSSINQYTNKIPDSSLQVNPHTWRVEEIGKEVGPTNEENIIVQGSLVNPEFSVTKLFNCEEQGLKTTALYCYQMEEVYRMEPVIREKYATTIPHPPKGSAMAKGFIASDGHNVEWRLCFHLVRKNAKERLDAFMKKMNSLEKLQGEEEGDSGDRGETKR